MERQQFSDDQHGSTRRRPETDALLRESIRGSGLEGTPLHIQSMPFTVNRDAQIAGMMGPPAWVVRLKRIHDARESLKARLDAAWLDYAHRYRTNEEFACRWRDFLSCLDITQLNTLIKKHNDYYPIEARLPIVWPTGEYRVPPGVEYPQPLVTAEQLLDDYPPDRDMALFFSERV